MKSKTIKMSFVNYVGKDKAKARSDSRKSKAQARARAEKKANKYKIVF